MDNLISVIIPAYNAEKFLERCLTSVLNQTYKNLEVIVVNDGSVDLTSKIMDSFACKDARIKTHHKQNSGVSDTRNFGLQVAGGNYIGFVDADDEIVPEMYESLLNNLLDNDAEIAHCGFELVMLDKVKFFGGNNKKVIQSRQEALKSLLKGDLFEPSTCTKLYSRKILRDVFYIKDLRFNEDLVFNAQAFNNASKIIYEDRILYRYIFNSQSASQSTANLTILQNIIPAAKVTIEKIKGTGLDRELNAFYSGKLLTVKQALLHGSKSTSDLMYQINSELKNLPNFGLSLRLLFLKYSLLYFPFLYHVARKLYDRTAGRNKKWDIN